VLAQAAGAAEPPAAAPLAQPASGEPATGDDEPAVRVARPYESRAFEAPAAAAPEPTPAPAPAPAPVALPRFELPVSDLDALASAAGLQWVHSDAERVRAAQEAIANTPKPVHVPRERPPVVEIDEGPLVLVETRKDLSRVQLPFDTAGAVANAADTAGAPLQE
jgi:ribonuclease E